MVLSWPLSFSQTILSVTCLYFSYSAYYHLTLGASRRRFITSNGCKPIRKWHTRDPFFGIDFLWALLMAAKEHRSLEMMKERFDNWGTTTAQIKLFTRTLVSTIEPENIKSVLARDFRSYSLSESRKAVLRPILGEGIFTTDGKEWQHSREMLRPSFVRAQIGDVDMFEKHVEHLIQAIPKDGSTVDLQRLFYRLSLDVATDLLFGESTNTLAPGFADAEVGEFADAYAYCLEFLDGSDLVEDKNTYLAFAWVFLRFFLPNSKFKQKIRVVNNYVDKLIENAARNQEIHESKGQLASATRYVFLHELVSQTTDKIKIRSELLNILLAGRDTTASLLSSVWFVLANRPDVWDRLQREIDDSLDGARPTFEKLKDMKYLRAVLNESLRLYPVVPENDRQADVDTVLPVGGGEDGQSPAFVAKGQIVHWNLYTMHRRKDLYGEDADDFKPERWLDQDEKKGLRVGWEYLPFNGGPRICIGQQFALTEASYVTVRLMQQFPTIESRDPGPWREKVTLTCTCLGGCKVALFPASSHSTTTSSPAASGT